MGKNLKQIVNPVKFKSGNYNSYFAGVGIGYHNPDILKSLSFSDGDINKFREISFIN